MSNKQIASHFNVGNYCTISRTITRLKDELAINDKLNEITKSISQDLTS